MVAAAHGGMPSTTAANKAVTAAVIGNVLEWYDFSVYAFVAITIGAKFFPAGSETTKLLATFGAFGLGFVARPLGGIVLGRLGDTRGRKTALVLTILLMAIGTTLIGLIPSYDSIGIAAPLLLVFARLLQGFSAGGEWGGSTTFIVEWAPATRRGFYGSFQQSSVVAGLLLGSAVVAVMNTLLTAEVMSDWGWRVPFLLGAILGPVGIYLRRNADETPAYQRVTAQRATTTQPEAIAPFWLAARAFGFTIHWTVIFYIFLSYMPTFSQKFLKLTPTDALWSGTIGLLVLVVAIPLFGTVSDRIGRKPLLLVSCIAFIALPYPVLSWMLSGNATFGTAVAMQILFALCISLYSGAGPAAIAEIFSTRVRSTWMTTGYALSVAIFGGFAPFIATWLIDTTGSPLTPVFYVMAASIITTLVVMRLRETAHEPLA